MIYVCGGIDLRTGLGSTVAGLHYSTEIVNYAAKLSMFDTFTVASLLNSSYYTSTESILPLAEFTIVRRLSAAIYRVRRLF